LRFSQHRDAGTSERFARWRFFGSWRAATTNREIADALTIAEGTVKNYISSILSKMGVRDRTRAVLKALEGGFL